MNDEQLVRVVERAGRWYCYLGAGRIGRVDGYEKPSDAYQARVRLENDQREARKLSNYVPR